MILANFRQVYEKQEMLSKLVNKGCINNYSISEIHCIDFIKKIEDANVTKLSEALSMTKGAISKITQKLLKMGAILSYTKADNKKKVYFKLSSLGEELYLIHEKGHSEWEKRDRVFIDKINTVEQEIIVKFLEEFNDYLKMQIEEISNNED